MRYLQPHYMAGVENKYCCVKRVLLQYSVDLFQRTRWEKKGGVWYAKSRANVRVGDNDAKREIRLHATIIY